MADLIIGAPYADPNGDSGAGESYVVFGKASASTVDLANLGSNGGFRIEGIDAATRLASPSPAPAMSMAMGWPI